MNAQVWRWANRLIHGALASATGVVPVVTFGLRYSGIQSSSQRNPNAPVPTNAHCHPHLIALHGTRSGVTIAPMFVPALNIPVARARSSCGNHSAIVLMDPGKIADSLTPSIA